MGQFVGAMTNTPSSEANTAVTLSRWLRDFPILAAGFADGDISMAHLRILRTRLDTTYDNHVELKNDQEFFVNAARDTNFKGFMKACGYWLSYVDPDGAEPKDQIDAAGLRLRTGRGGRCRLEADLDAVSGQALTTMVDHEANKLRAIDKANGVERTEAARRLAALLQLATRGFQRPDGTVPVPLINIVMSLEVAEWARKQIIDPSPGPVPVDPNHVDGRCEFIDGTPVHPLLVAAVCGFHRFGPLDLRRYVFEADSRLLDVSVSARSFPEWMRTAHHVQSRGACDTPGCDAPFRWLNIDHVDPVNNGGSTEFWNGQPQCEADNQAKGATTGHTPWRDRPDRPDRRHRPDPTQPRAPDPGANGDAAPRPPNPNTDLSDTGLRNTSDSRDSDDGEHRHR
jgi:hypothetical protein